VARMLLRSFLQRTWQTNSINNRDHQRKQIESMRPDCGTYPKLFFDHGDALLFCKQVINYTWPILSEFGNVQ
jgi:hypothetical protein